MTEDYEDISLHSTTFDKLQRKVHNADVIGKKKLSSAEGLLDVSCNILSIVSCPGPKEPAPPAAKSDGKLYIKYVSLLHMLPDMKVYQVHCDIPVL